MSLPIPNQSDKGSAATPRLIPRSGPELKVIDDEQIMQILNKIDQDLSGQIEYSEFLTHSLSKKHVSEENIQILFDDIIKTG